MKTLDIDGVSMTDENSRKDRETETKLLNTRTRQESPRTKESKPVLWN